MIGAVIAKRAVAQSYDAISRQDLDTLQGMFHEDAVLEFPGDTVMSGRFEGWEAIRGWFERWFKMSPETRFTPRHVLVENIFALGASNVEVGFMSQNLLLAESALGLGGWPFGGFTAMMVLGGTPVCRGLGFRFETAEHGLGAGIPYPIGKDGVFETHHPHYFGGSIDDAVDDVIERKWGDKGIFNAAGSDGAPYKNPGQMEKEIPRTDPAYVECTKDILKAVWKKWKRFPAFADASLLTVMVQAHHLELGFYDEHYKDGAYTDRHRRHMEKWHGKKQAKLRAA